MDYFDLDRKSSKFAEIIRSYFKNLAVWNALPIKRTFLAMPELEMLRLTMMVQNTNIAVH